MHYTTKVIRQSKTGDKGCWVYKKIVFHPWRRTKKLHCVYLLYSLNHTITFYWPLCFLKVIIFLLCNRQGWRSDVKCLAKARIWCLDKTDYISHVVIMDECEEMVKWGCWGGSEGTLQICLNINCYNTVKQNYVLYSVMTTCFGLKRTLSGHHYKHCANKVQYRANCAC
jgi:hypothetical protein